MSGAAPSAPADANAVRALPSYPDVTILEEPILRGCGQGRHHVMFCLTPHAPDCAAMPIVDRQRWPHFWNVTPAEAVGGLLRLLKRGPRDVQAVALKDASAAVITVKPAAIVPLAFCWDLTAAELEAGREVLARARAEGARR